MLLRRLALKNVRSYNDGEETYLEFPDGVVLFEGDVGSGKSTILYALEFALFGFSDMKGAYLLSEGRKEGRVSLTFESGGREYTVERRLKARGDEVVQGECRISIDGAEERLSPSDLKERIVSILGFNEPTHPRAETLVYRYAVFTPQEQMKEILTQNADERLHVVRRVLGAQSYQVAAENSEIIEKRIKEIGYGLKKASEDLEEKKDEAEEKSRSIAELESEIPRLRDAASKSSKLVNTLASEWKDTLLEREGLSKNEAKVPLLRQEVEGLEGEIRENEQKIHDHEVQLTEIEPEIRAFESMKPAGDIRELETESDNEKEKLGRFKESKRHLEEELAKASDLIAKGVCPLCGQPIPRDMSIRNEHTQGELVKLGDGIAASERLLASLTLSLEQSRRFEEAKKDSARAMNERARIDKEVAQLRKKVQGSTMRSSQLKRELLDSEAMVRTMREVSARAADLESQLERARKDEKAAGEELARTATELRDATRELTLLSEEVKKKEAALSEARRLTSYQGWLATFFRPTVELIEKQTLAQAAARFNDHFQRFFNTLVDDPDMVVRVTEDFTPVFEREGFEQDFDALSGGERTSMALSYRFSLNAVVKESVPTRPELVILDEPTDGFSKDQIYKMRGLLGELGSRQVILVSHEKELESMADHIFRVEKQNGTSVISDTGPHNRGAGKDA